MESSEKMSMDNRSLCTLQMSRKQYPHLPDHKLATVDDAKLAAMIWLEMGKKITN